MILDEELLAGMPAHVRDRIRSMTPEQVAAEAEAGIARQRERDMQQLQIERTRVAQDLAAKHGGERGLPKRYTSTRWEDVPPAAHADDADARRHDLAYRTTRRFADVLIAGREPGLSLMFNGGTGTGKTSLACALANALLDAGHTMEYMTAIEFFRRMKACFGDRGSHETELSIMASLKVPDLLILDEVGRGFKSPAEQLWLFDVIDQRYREGRSMVLISNLQGAKLRDGLGDAAYSRMEQACRNLLLDFTWPDFRPAKGGRS